MAGESRSSMSGENEIEKRANLEGFAASVELPEGHQLVLGELPPGTVVEVATWQGTGRPDETTNRFLLSASGPGLQRRQRRDENPQLEDVQSKNEAPQPAINAPAAPAQKHSQQSTGSIGATSSYLGMRTFASETSQPVRVVDEKTTLRKVGRSIFSAVAVVAISAMVLSLLGISVTVPTRGAKTTFGSSTSSLVVYKKGTSVELGAATVAILTKDGTEEILFGPSNTFDAEFIQIETTAGQELVPANSVAGRAFLAIPFLGSIASIFIK
jgi:hypothetical protein